MAEKEPKERGLTKNQFAAVEIEAKALPGYSDEHWQQLSARLKEKHQIWSEDFYALNILPDPAMIDGLAHSFGLKVNGDLGKVEAYTAGMKAIIDESWKNAEGLGCIPQTGPFAAPPAPPTQEELDKMPFLFCIMCRMFCKDMRDASCLSIGIFDMSDPRLWDSYLFAQFILEHLDAESVQSLQMVDLNLYSNESNKDKRLVIPSWLMTSNRLYFNKGKVILPMDVDIQLERNRYPEVGNIRRYAVYIDNGPYYTPEAITSLDAAKATFLQGLEKNPKSRYETAAIYCMNEYMQIIGFYIYSKNEQQFKYISNSHIEKQLFTEKIHGLWLAFRWTKLFRAMDKLLIIYCAIMFNVAAALYPFYLMTKFGYKEVGVMYANGQLQERWQKVVKRDFIHFFILSTLLYITVIYLVLT
jgi:hypothetical protein